MKQVLILSSLLLLAACGGGGGGDGANAATTLGAMHGNMSVTAVEVLTQNPTSTTPISFRVGATFTGTLSPERASFTVPVIVQRGDATMTSTNASTQGDMAFALSAGTAASGVWAGSGTYTMSPQPAGDHVFSATAVPINVFDFTGGWGSAVTGTVSIAP
jgi:hypothetical protein